VINDKYLVLDNPSRYFIVTGGRGSGKSFSINTLLCILTQEQGHVILFTRFTLRAASISIIPEFIEKIELLEMESQFYVTKDEITNINTGSKILFRGIKTSSGNQVANLKSLQGVTTWVLDEAEELVDESIFDTIDLSVRQKGIQNRIVMIMNPTTKEHFIYNRFFEGKGVQEGSNLMKGDTTYIHTTYKDNIENLSESYLNQIEDIRKRRPKKYQHQILGGWLNKAEGVIFENWTLGEFKHVGSSVFGQDFGFSVDPSTLVETNIDTTNKVIYLRLHFYKPNLTTTQIAELNNRIATDSLIVADSAEPRLITELSSKGNNIVPTIKGQGSVIYGISLMQDYDLVIDPESTELIKELNNYCWLEKKSSTPVDNHNHAIDAIRYAVSYQLDNPNRGKYFIK
jgi:phage terminase large subunit